MAALPASRSPLQYLLVFLLSLDYSASEDLNVKWKPLQINQYAIYLLWFISSSIDNG